MARMAGAMHPGAHAATMPDRAAAIRSGLVITAINRSLTAEEAAHIVGDCGAKALVTSMALAEAAGLLAAERTANLRGRVARYMVPKSIDFTEALPRLPTGKLYKAALREQYRARAG